jgi:hypothetical protein
MNNKDVLTDFLGTVQTVLVPTLDFKRHGRRAGPHSPTGARATRRADDRKDPHHGSRNEAEDPSYE